MAQAEESGSGIAIGPCWSCKSPVAPLALFCSHCGAVQAPAKIDPFSRLGLHRSYGLDGAELDRHYAGFCSRLDPGRFAARSSREQALAAQQRGAFGEAYETLHDPLKRAIYLLRQAGRSLDLDHPGSLDDDPALRTELAELRKALAVAESLEVVDRLLARLEVEGEHCQRLLAEAFDVDEIDLAAILTTRLICLEGVRQEALARRVHLVRGTP